MGKKALCLIFAFLLCINSFAAVVSDNDGTAFVTKAEFEALKQNFADQVTNYNDSIDSKIDGAIASYLAGTIKKRTMFTPYYKVDSSENYVTGVEEDYNTIKKQLWNRGSGQFAILGSGGGAPRALFPYLDSGGNANSWTYAEEQVQNYLNYFPSFEFDEAGNIVKIWEEDNLSLCVNTIWTGDNAAGYFPSSQAIMAGFLTTGYDNLKKLNVAYTNALNSSNNRYTTMFTGTSQTSNSYKQSDFTSNFITNNYKNFLIDVSNSYAHTNPSWQWWDIFRDGTFVIKNSQFIASKVQNISKEAKYIYNKCNAMIYAHPTNGDTLETFLDPYTTSYDVHSYGKEYQFWTNASTWNAVPNKITVNSAVVAATTNLAHHYGIFLKKFKIKNDTTNNDLKPILGPETVKKWNNISQFRNGLLASYLDKNGNTVYPKFYGGLPLFNRISKPENLEFDLKFANTTTGINKIRVWIKKYEFPNEVYGNNAIWNSTDITSGNKYIDDLVVFQTKTITNNTEKYIDVDVNAKVTIVIDEPEKGVPYFIRWAEVNASGTCLNKGGKLVVLDNFVEVA